MGTLGAMGMAEAVNDGLASIDQALGWHLQSNHFPPVSVSFVPVCKAAIEHAALDDWDVEVELPEGCTYKGQSTAPVIAIVVQHHLEAFVEQQIHQQLVEDGDIDEDDEL